MVPRAATAAPVLILLEVNMSSENIVKGIRMKTVEQHRTSSSESSKPHTWYLERILLTRMRAFVCRTLIKQSHIINTIGSS